MKTTRIPTFASRLRAPLPDMVRETPSMMSIDERKLLFHRAKHEYRA